MQLSITCVSINKQEPFERTLIFSNDARQLKLVVLCMCFSHTNQIEKNQFGSIFYYPLIAWNILKGRWIHLNIFYCNNLTISKYIFPLVNLTMAIRLDNENSHAWILILLTRLIFVVKVFWFKTWEIFYLTSSLWMKWHEMEWKIRNI